MPGWVGCGGTWMNGKYKFQSEYKAFACPSVSKRWSSDSTGKELVDFLNLVSASAPSVYSWVKRDTLNTSCSVLAFPPIMAFPIILSMSLYTCTVSRWWSLFYWRNTAFIRSLRNTIARAEARRLAKSYLTAAPALLDTSPMLIFFKKADTSSPST